MIPKSRPERGSGDSPNDLETANARGGRDTPGDLSQISWVPPKRMGQDVVWVSFHARTDELRISCGTRHNDWDLAAKATNQKTSDSSVKRFCSAPSSNSVADKDGDPTFQAHPTAEAIGGPHQKSALTRPV